MPINKLLHKLSPWAFWFGNLLPDNPSAGFIGLGLMVKPGRLAGDALKAWVQ
jgi:hypothetical protein